MLSYRNCCKNGTMLLMCLYRSPSQNGRQFQFACNSLHILLNNINSLNPAIAGYINGKCLKSYHCIDTQIIDKPTHFTNHSSSCIDLIFTSNPSIIVDSGIEKSLCSSCHHNILYRNIRVPLPPPHFRTIWDYRNADYRNADVGSFNVL